MYKIGDHVVYGKLTVCKIEEIATPSFESNKEKKYYKLSPVFDNHSNTTIFVPCGAEENLRPVIDASTAQSALKELPKVKPTVFAAKKTQFIIAHYQELLDSNDVRKHLYLVKEIALKEKTQAKKLNESDGRFRAKTEKLLCEEFALALNETPESIKQKIYEAL